MSRLGIIGGTGLTRLQGLETLRREVVNTPYGEPTARSRTAGFTAPRSPLEPLTADVTPSPRTG